MIDSIYKESVYSQYSKKEWYYGYRCRWQHA
jgi:hypothetical protein